MEIFGLKAGMNVVASNTQMNSRALMCKRTIEGSPSWIWVILEVFWIEKKSNQTTKQTDRLITEHSLEGKA